MDSAPLEPVLLSGTSSEYLGRKPLPRSVRQRRLIIVTGPAGVGKTTVANRIAGLGAVHVEGKALHHATVEWIRRTCWAGPILECPHLVLDAPVFLPRRPGAASALKELIRRRVEAGRVTVLCEGSVSDGSIGLLMDAVPPEVRATITLRFPVGRGRLRFARHTCDDLGLEGHQAHQVTSLDPWTYARVVEALTAIRDARQGYGSET